MKQKTHRIQTASVVGYALLFVVASLVGSLFARHDTASAAAFTCTTSRYFLSLNEGNEPNIVTRLVEQFADTSGAFSYQELGVATVSYNAIGYNKTDNFIYGITREGSDSRLVRVHHDGSYEGVALLTDIGFTAGDATNQLWQSGVIEGNQYYVGYSNASATYMYKIDLTDTSNPVATRINYSQPTDRVGDFIYLAGYLWSIQGDGVAVRINPITGDVLKITQTAVPATNAAWMGMWQYGDGSVGVVERAPGTQLVRFSIDNPTSAAPTFTRIVIAQPPVAGNGDGTSCAFSRIDLGITVSAPAEVDPNERFDVTYTVTNHSPEDSSGYVVIQELPSNFTDYTVSTPGCKIEDGKLQCVLGQLQSGGSTDIVVSMTSSSDATCGTHQGRVYGNDQDDNPANDIASAQTCVRITGTNPVDPEDPTVPVPTVPNTGAKGEVSAAGVVATYSTALLLALLLGGGAVAVVRTLLKRR